MSKKLIAVLILIAVSTMGCAQRSANIVPNSVSSFQYANQDCFRLQAELENKQSRLSQLSSKQDKMATTDTVAMTVGLLLFWPALAVNAVTPDHKAEIAQLKGEVSALSSAVNMECNTNRNDNPNRNFARGSN